MRICHCFRQLRRTQTWIDMFGGSFFQAGRRVGSARLSSTLFAHLTLYSVSETVGSEVNSARSMCMVTRSNERTLLVESNTPAPPDAKLTPCMNASSFAYRTVRYGGGEVGSFIFSAAINNVRIIIPN